MGNIQVKCSSYTQVVFNLIEGIREIETKYSVFSQVDGGYDIRI